MRLRFTRLATDDLDDVFTFVAARDGEAAATDVLGRIDKAIAGLIMFPERGRSGRLSGTRELIVPTTPFLVAYRVRGREIVILAIIHGARRWPGTL
jgi:toxin ParE1/3/4